MCLVRTEREDQSFISRITFSTSERSTASWAAIQSVDNPRATNRRIELRSIGVVVPRSLSSNPAEFVQQIIGAFEAGGRIDVIHMKLFHFYCVATHYSLDIAAAERDCLFTGRRHLPLPCKEDAVMDLLRHFTLFDAFIIATLVFVMVAGYIEEKRG